MKIEELLNNIEGYIIYNNFNNEELNEKAKLFVKLYMSF